MITGPEVFEWLAPRRDAMAAYVSELAAYETPSDDPRPHRAALVHLGESLEGVGLRARHFPGDRSGGFLLARPRHALGGAPYQLVLGHIDTVWPTGTLEHMPVTRRDSELAGPGVFDMKGGLTQLVFALRALRALQVDLPVAPVVLVNSDEEIGSRESTRHIVRVAKGSCRALVLEPSLGSEGKLKTARKGLGRFTVTIHGRASHAGLAPGAGASAILELSHQVQALFALNDPARGVTVNVGVVEGGTQPNVVAPRAAAVVDVRVRTHDEADRIEARIRSLTPHTDGTRLEIVGGFGRPPMEPTAQGRALFELARRLGDQLGLDLQSAAVGGGSDGNTTAQHTPTLDGLGPVGGGAHAPDEHLDLDALVKRAALLALLLAAPLLEEPHG